jgi:uncharacterized protein (TIGR00730 family)
MQRQFAAGLPLGGSIDEARGRMLSSRPDAGCRFLLDRANGSLACVKMCASNLLAGAFPINESRSRALISHAAASEQIRRVAVYCGSSEGTDSHYRQLSYDLGRELAMAGLGLVYGGGQVGLMGALCEGALSVAGEVIGVIPAFLEAKERVNADNRIDLRIVQTMEERKQLYYSLADAFVALPGGYGTFEEFFEVLTRAHLGIVRGPVILLNSSSYYDGIVTLFNSATRAGFVSGKQRDLVCVESSVASAIARLTRQRCP